MLDSCSFRDEDDDCTYQYTVENSADRNVKDLEVQVLEKKGELHVRYASHMLCAVISATHVSLMKTHSCCNFVFWKVLSLNPFISIVLVVEDRYLRGIVHARIKDTYSSLPVVLFINLDGFGVSR